MTPTISFADKVILVTAAAGIGLATADAGLPPSNDRRNQT
jgi:hypothetical protein